MRRANRRIDTILLYIPIEKIKNGADKATIEQQRNIKIANNQTNSNQTKPED